MSADAVLIAGPTASGKSAAALGLAERIGGALINADSMQIYKEACILTARPTDAEMRRAPHLLYGHVSVHEPYNVARYALDAARALNEVREQGLVPIFVGGTGLYFGALTKGIPEMPKVPPSVRDATRSRREQLGADAFFAELAGRDPETAAHLRASDTQRVLRAFEVLEATGRPLGQWQKGECVPVLGEAHVARFVLSPSRPELHRCIEARFDAMLEAGAINEAVRLDDIDPAMPSAKILGLRELNAARAGNLSLEAARAAAIAATRQYAKRQVTWFRHRMKDWHWLDAESEHNIISCMAPFVA